MQNTIIPTENIDLLASVKESYCYSTYIPLHLQEPLNSKEILEKNITNLTSSLKEKGFGSQRLFNYINPLLQLIQDKSVWENKAKGIAIFINESGSYHYFIEKEIDYTATLNSSFHILPLFKEAPLTATNEEKVVTNKIEKVIVLAYADKVDQLLVSESNNIYGVYDTHNQSIMIDNKKKPDNTSLLNLAAIKTHLNGANVHLINKQKSEKEGIFIQAKIK